jgi:hypothetical protein
MSFNPTQINHPRFSPYSKLEIFNPFHDPGIDLTTKSQFNFLEILAHGLRARSHWTLRVAYIFFEKGEIPLLRSHWTLRYATRSAAPPGFRLPGRKSSRAARCRFAN